MDMTTETQEVKGIKGVIFLIKDEASQDASSQYSKYNKDLNDNA